MVDFKDFYNNKDEYFYILETDSPYPSKGILEEIQKYAKLSKGKYFVLVKENVKDWRKKINKVARRIKAYEDKRKNCKEIFIKLNESYVYLA